jgi:hypothetical protein
VHVQVTPYFVRRVDVGPEEVTLRLSDGSAEPLDPGTLRLYEDRFLHCRVKGGAHEARFGRAAWHDLARMIERDPRGDGVFLALGGARYPIETAGPT